MATVPRWLRIPDTHAPATPWADCIPHCRVCYQPIIDYIDAQLEAYLQEELKIKRSFFEYHDSRVHVCLYFISPTGHSLKSLDLLTMKNIDSRVNIIPLIAKADTISKTDLQKFKSKIMNELISNGIQIYKFPTDDETTAQRNSSMNGLLPFAVVGSMDEVKVGKRMVRGRHYPWGVLQGKYNERGQALE
ncbi:PREDICTED: septin-14-like [Propithecus coquereli]|uniref:septin-14-like n=1 Tax=Propithecus coquereli TaxID=379532 RepID=UPI00063FA70A|nr:PREDICTED: septin-14-like [Propithecus coquereli]